MLLDVYERTGESVAIAIYYNGKKITVIKTLLLCASAPLARYFNSSIHEVEILIIAQRRRGAKKFMTENEIGRYGDVMYKIHVELGLAY